MDFSSCTEGELWVYVAVALKKAGIDSVLVGGAVAAIYSEGVYRSGDLDLVVESYIFTNKEITAVMNSIGFHKVNRHWKHEKCDHLLVEFVQPPVAIGEDYRINPIHISKDGEMIKILSPYDCVRDRLCSYVYFNARECLDQAFLVVV